MRLYIETRIRAAMDVLWERTQDPAQHQRWDLRFTHIRYLARIRGEPQRFTYGVRVLPGLLVSGTGTTVGERHHADGSRTSVLRFASPHPLSLIADGSGYWRYVPEPAGIRFLTGYDYTPRWGRFGRVVDRIVFRPLMGWGTAWSFDRLRLWCEQDIPPERTLRRGLAELAARTLAVSGAIAIAVLDGGAPAMVLPVVVLVAAIAVPPLPGTPSARRCLRRPPEPVVAMPPVLVDRLEPA